MLGVAKCGWVNFHYRSIMTISSDRTCIFFRRRARVWLMEMSTRSLMIYEGEGDIHGTSHGNDW